MFYKQRFISLIILFNCRYLGHMTLIANQMGIIAGRRKVVRAFLEASAQWQLYSETYLKVSPGRRCLICL